MTAQGYKYLSPPSAHTVGILLLTPHISTSLSRIAIHKGLSVRCDSTRASRTYTVIYLYLEPCVASLWIQCFIIFLNKHCLLQVGLLSLSTSRQATYIALPSPRAVIVKIGARYLNQCWLHFSQWAFMFTPLNWWAALTYNHSIPKSFIYKCYIKIQILLISFNSPPFSKRHFPMHFLEWKRMNFD